MKSGCSGPARTIAQSRDCTHSRREIRVLARGGLDPLNDLRSWKPDVVHIHNTFPNIGTRWLPKWRGPVAMSFHNYWTACSQGTLFRNGNTCHDCVNSKHIPCKAVVHSCYRNSKAASIPVAKRPRPPACCDPTPRKGALRSFALLGGSVLDLTHREKNARSSTQGDLGPLSWSVRCP